MARCIHRGMFPFPEWDRAMNTLLKSHVLQTLQFSTQSTLALLIFLPVLYAVSVLTVLQQFRE